MAFGYYLWFCLLGIFTCFIGGTVGREAIIGGNETNSGFRYQAFVQVDKVHNCSGGAIYYNLILTAARCVVDDHGLLFTSHTTIVTGSYSIDKGVLFEVVDIRVPPEYKPQNKQTLADFALLKTSQPMLSSKSRIFARLSLPRDNRDYAGRRAWIAGLGTTKPGKSLSLLHVETEILSHKQCQAVYGNRRTIERNQICARIKKLDNEHRGVCQGDEGAPLVLDDVTVIGILSVIPSHCDKTHLPAIYTRVSSYRNHIANYISWMN